MNKFNYYEYGEDKKEVDVIKEMSGEYGIFNVSIEFL